jgi:hypothetical protein
MPRFSSFSTIFYISTMRLISFLTSSTSFCDMSSRAEVADAYGTKLFLPAGLRCEAPPPTWLLLIDSGPP